ncbi:MAG: hypothetical protein HZA95_04285 [Candidatus Vogelbacteria bacterium]|nr:hypothetical protein [Candidatus Vogelbacteria bacterium]
MQSLITSAREGELPSLAAFRGTALYDHLERHGWRPWRFGQHGVDVLMKIGPIIDGKPEYRRFAFAPIGTDIPVSDTRTLRRLLKAVFEDVCERANVDRGDFLDANPY